MTHHTAQLSLLNSQKLSCPLDRLRYHCVLQSKTFSIPDKRTWCDYARGLHSLKTEHNSDGLQSKYLLRFLVFWKQPLTTLSYSARNSLPFIFLTGSNKIPKFRALNRANSGGNPNSPDLHHISKQSQDSENLLTQMKIGNGSRNLNYPVYSFIREKNRQCNLLFVFLMVSGIFMY